MILLNPPKPVLCKHCGKPKDRHRARTYECSKGRGNFPMFIVGQFYEPRKTRKPTTTQQSET